ncbi:hypothetical protein H0266_02275 [Halobacillus locisalis]|uniref:Uncharacterized protein n=1 Tax=Halobacillus locisalis TaxID=220753 RepID=A0A838CQ11_9BACI|nr:hypothetical protein [Halobacillus locisalis]MBA2173716.1 hypothetical protein [Halobacillus locisalis]
MKRWLLIVLVVMNALYIYSTFVDWNIRWGNVWTMFMAVLLLGSMVLSGWFLLRSRKRSGYHPYLSVVLLSLSIASFGWFAFLNYLSFIMG